MLDSLVLMLKSSLEVALILTVVLLTLQKSNLVRHKAAVWLGVTAAGLLAIGVVYFADFFGDREIFEGYWSFGASLVELFVIGWIWWLLFHKEKREPVRKSKIHYGVTGVFLFLTICVLTLGKAIDIVLFPNTILAMESNFLSSDLVLKMAAAMTGILIALTFVFTLLRLEARITRKSLLVFSAAIFTVMIFRQLIMVLQIAFATGLLPLTTWAVSIIAPLINSYYPVFFYLLIGFSWLLWILVRHKLKTNLPVLDELKNPAAKRKIMSGYIREKRWVIGVGAVLLTIVTAIGANSVLAKQGPKIEPPEPVKAVDGKISIPAGKINDGNLHRFSYTTADNVETRFIVIKKGDRLYGTGLDACDICGVTGYYQRDKEVICKNCDVVINIPTIGFPGGCNPIPIKNKFNGQELVINVEELDSKQDTFTK